MCYPIQRKAPINSPPDGDPWRQRRRLHDLSDPYCYTQTPQSVPWWHFRWNLAKHLIVLVPSHTRFYTTFTVKYWHFRPYTLFPLEICPKTIHSALSLLFFSLEQHFILPLRSVCALSNFFTAGRFFRPFFTASRCNCCNFYPFSRMRRVFHSLLIARKENQTKEDDSSWSVLHFLLDGPHNFGSTFPAMNRLNSHPLEKFSRLTFLFQILADSVSSPAGRKLCTVGQINKHYSFLFSLSAALTT